MSTRWEEVAVHDDIMPCYFAQPEGPKPVPGVIVCMHAPGVDTFIQSIVERLAEAGFAALAPNLYHRDPSTDEDPLTRMGRLRDDEIIEDLQAATQHLRSLPWFSMEGTSWLAGVLPRRRSIDRRQSPARSSAFSGRTIRIRAQRTWRRFTRSSSA